LDEDKPIFTPEDFLRYEAARRNINIDHFQVPDRLLLSYQTRIIEYIFPILNKKQDWFYGPFRPINTGIVNNKKIGAFRASMGASSAAAVLEELCVCGAKYIVEIGVAGSLHSSLTPGDIVVVTEAFRDEGTSYHYFPPDVSLGTSPLLKTHLIRELKQHGLTYQEGPVWTTDGLFRETRRKFLKFRDDGALAVNMETSALFAVAKFRQIELASIQVISDVLSEQGWTPAFHHKAISESLQSVLTVVLDVLAKV
jgi:uridine phosphorylase